MYCYRISGWLGPVWFVLAVTVLLSCESEKQPATFYPVDSLISDQIKYLSGIRAGLFKEALLSGKMDTATITPVDTTAWKKELEIFRKLDEINRPVNKEYYEVTDGQIDPLSNLKVHAVLPRKELSDKVREQLQVVYLKIYYQGNIGKPRKIEAQYDEGNQLFESARFLSMHFQQIENRTVLTSYSVKGGQKMVFGDSVAFFIGGKVLVD
jgi:hypothetical protein